MRGIETFAGLLFCVISSTGGLLGRVMGCDMNSDALSE